jgi:hypothetical protein
LPSYEAPSFGPERLARIRERIRDVKRHLASQGIYNGGKRPFGYDVVDNRLVPNAGESKPINFRFGPHRGLKPDVPPIPRWAMTSHYTSGSFRRTVNNRKCRGRHCPQSHRDDRFFRPRNGTVALDSPDTANTIKVGVYPRTRRWSDREEAREQRVAREGIL